jgi:hypothetical protein
MFELKPPPTCSRQAGMRRSQDGIVQQLIDESHSDNQPHPMSSSDALRLILLMNERVHFWLQVHNHHAAQALKELLLMQPYQLVGHKRTPSRVSCPRLLQALDLLAHSPPTQHLPASSRPIIQTTLNKIARYPPREAGQLLPAAARPRPCGCRSPNAPLRLQRRRV